MHDHRQDAATLAEQELARLLRARADWSAVRSRVSRPDLYDQLIIALEESIWQEETPDQFRGRILHLGPDGVACVREVLGLVG